MSFRVGNAILGVLESDSTIHLLRKGRILFNYVGCRFHLATKSRRAVELLLIVQIDR